MPGAASAAPIGAFHGVLERLRATRPLFSDGRRTSREADHLAVPARLSERNGEGFQPTDPAPQPATGWRVGDALVDGLKSERPHTRDLSASRQTRIVSSLQSLDLGSRATGFSRLSSRVSGSRNAVTWPLRWVSTNRLLTVC